MNYRLKLLLIIVSALFGVRLMAVPASPAPIKIKQPDGTQITVVLKGDEFFHYRTTTDGYPIIKSDQGIFHYALVSEKGNLTMTDIKASDIKKRSQVEKKFLKTLPDNLTTLINSRLKKSKIATPLQRTSQQGASKYPTTGTPKSLVILVNFSDLSFVVQNPQTAFTDLLNKEGYNDNYGTGSARDYFRDNSMGVFNPQFDVVGPFTLPQKYSYYGKNDKDGYDLYPVQMIVDACTLASQNGVDFAQYDTNNDSFVDNVFVYYAGHNEAENGPENTIWPHRWLVQPGSNYTGTKTSITFNGKQIYDYACTSELKSSSGNNMCGIGTFCHEFGHVLGLVDFYATNDSKHHTLSYWDIMDSGPYLNSGITPPGYSAHERFFLGWLTPQLANSPIDGQLEPINTSNKAYIITETGNHNLNGQNPFPAEYFLLENRQKTGWDKYLPGHGMLVTHVYYNASTWDSNSPNNDQSKMGVDIVEADNIANDNSLEGDPFPGTSNITKYTPVLRSGTALNNYAITEIKENGELITFNFMRLITSANFTTFKTVEGKHSTHQTISVSGAKLSSPISISFENNTDFQMKKENDTEWNNTVALSPTDSVVENTNIEIRYNPDLSISKSAIHTDKILISTANASTASYTIQGNCLLTPIAHNATDITYGSFIANWNATVDGTNLVNNYYLTVYTFENNGDTLFLKKDKLLNINTDTIYNLLSDRDYYYYLKAGDESLKYVTSYSNTMKVKTLPYTSKKVLRVVVDQNESLIKVFTPSRGSIVNVYNAIGQKVKSIVSNDEIVDIQSLPRKQIYIIQSGKYRAKVALW